MREGIVTRWVRSIVGSKTVVMNEILWYFFFESVETEPTDFKALWLSLIYPISCLWALSHFLSYHNPHSVWCMIFSRHQYKARTELASQTQQKVNVLTFASGFVYTGSLHFYCPFFKKIVARDNTRALMQWSPPCFNRQTLSSNN